MQQQVRRTVNTSRDQSLHAGSHSSLIAAALSMAMLSIFSVGRMKLVIQRVARATVMVEGVEAGDIGPGLRWDPVAIQSRQRSRDAGLVILLGITLGDSVELAKRLAAKALTPACIKQNLPMSGQPKPQK